MENASKALIIAGAILISILIISFGVIILGQGSQVINNADMSDAEITAFNAKFEAYEGTSVRGSNVKQLYKVVLQHNIANKADDSKQVEITGAVALTKSATSVDTSGIKAGSTYEVKCVYNDKGSGLIDKITVTAK